MFVYSVYDASDSMVFPMQVTPTLPIRIRGWEGVSRGITFNSLSSDA